MPSIAIESEECRILLAPTWPEHWAVFDEIEQASMGDISARAVSSKATLYRYFDSKESLFIELVRHTAVGPGSQMMSLLYRGGGMTDNSRRSNELVDPYALLDPGKDVASTLSSFGQHVLKAFHTPHALGVNRMVIAASVNPPLKSVASPMNRALHARSAIWNSISAE